MAAIVAKFRLPALIVTLGTSSLIYGFNLFFIGSQDLFNVLSSIGAFSRSSLFVVTDQTGRSWALAPPRIAVSRRSPSRWRCFSLHDSGRGIYALGGSREAAERVGLPVRRLEVLVFAVAGVLAAIAGMTQVVFFRNANPGALNGSELDVIAAVVLGGVSVTGGKVTVGGALLGLTFVAVMTTSLIMLGIPAAWQKVFVGAACCWASASRPIASSGPRPFPIPFSRMDEESGGKQMKPSHGSGLGSLLLTLAGIAVVLLAILSVAMPNQLPGSRQFASMGMQASELGMFGVAMTCRMLLGGIDLSIVAVANLSAILAGIVDPIGRRDGACLAGVRSGRRHGAGRRSVAGLLNGLLIAMIGVPSILATLGTMTLLTGLAFGVTGGAAVFGLPDALVELRTP